jgi:hypothetical protein
MVGRATYRLLAAWRREQISKHCSLEPRGYFKQWDFELAPRLLAGWLISKNGKKTFKV